MNTSGAEAFHFDSTYLPILVIELHRKPSYAEHIAYFDTLERFYRENDLLVAIFDFRTNAPPNWTQMQAQAEWVKRNKALLAERGAGVAFVIRSTALRLALATLMTLQPSPQEYRAVGSMEEALEWAHERVLKVHRTRIARRFGLKGKAVG